MTSSSLFIDLTTCMRKRPIRGNASQRAGLYYERSVIKWFCSRYEFCAPQPDIKLGPYVVRRPDLLLFDSKATCCTVVEIKLVYTSKALDQVARYVQDVKGCYPWMSVTPLVIYGSIAGELPSCGDPCLQLSRRELKMGDLDCGLGLAGIALKGSVRKLGSSRYGVRRSG